jgi:hypothetical protein
MAKFDNTAGLDVLKALNDQLLLAKSFWTIQSLGEPLATVASILRDVCYEERAEGDASSKLPAMGMIVGIYALTFIASMAEAGWKVKTTFILATALAVISYVAFVKILKLQFPVWPAFITG